MRYFGPFASRAQAEILKISAFSLGIVRGGPADDITDGHGGA